jgi:hypothetical protein
MIKVEFDTKRSCSRWLVQSLAHKYMGVRLGPLFLPGRAVVFWQGRAFVAEAIDNKTKEVMYRVCNHIELSQAAMWDAYGTRPVRTQDGWPTDLLH